MRVLKISKSDFALIQNALIIAHKYSEDQADKWHDQISKYPEDKDYLELCRSQEESSEDFAELFYGLYMSLEEAANGNGN